MVKIKFKIRNLELKNPFFLAPMAEINDIAFRLLCKKAGAGLTYTGMINPKNQKKLQLDDKPAIQLFSTSDEGIFEFIKKYEQETCLFDFNLGCPAKTARKLKFGSFMHSRLVDIERILKTMREATDKPLTVKLRKSKNIGRILKVAEKYCDAICIHPRTQEQGYGGKADFDYALKIKKRTKLPIIYSGDVDENNCKKLAKKFDFVMIGRKAVGNPNIFAKLTGQDRGSANPISFKDYLKLAEKYSLSFSQIKLQAMNFTKSQSGAKGMRRGLIKAKTVKQIKDIYGI